MSEIAKIENKKNNEHDYNAVQFLTNLKTPWDNVKISQPTMIKQPTKLEEQKTAMAGDPRFYVQSSNEINTTMSFDEVKPINSSKLNLDILGSALENGLNGEMEANAYKNARVKRISTQIDDVQRVSDNLSKELEELDSYYEDINGVLHIEEFIDDKRFNVATAYNLIKDNKISEEEKKEIYGKYKFSDEDIKRAKDYDLILEGQLSDVEVQKILDKYKIDRNSVVSGITYLTNLALKNDEVYQGKLKEVERYLNENNLTIGMTYDDLKGKISEYNYNLSLINGLKKQYKFDLAFTEYDAIYLDNSFDEEKYNKKIEVGSDLLLNLNDLKDPKYLCLYNYLVENNPDEVNNYLQVIKDKLNQVEGEKRAQERIEQYNDANEVLKYLQAANYGFSDGIYDFGEGFTKIFLDGEMTAQDYEVMKYLEYLNTNDSFKVNVYEVAQGVGHMTPTIAASIAFSIVAPEIAGVAFAESGVMSNVTMSSVFNSAVIGASAYGTTKNQMLYEDVYDRNTILTYAALTATSDAVSEVLLGGIENIGINAAETNLAKQSFKEYASKFIKNQLQEAGEEVIQNTITKLVDWSYLGQKVDLGELEEENIKTFIQSAIVTGIINGAQDTYGFTFKKGGEVLESTMSKMALANIMEMINNGYSYEDAFNSYLDSNNLNKTSISTDTSDKVHIDMDLQLSSENNDSKALSDDVIKMQMEWSENHGEPLTLKEGKLYTQDGMEVNYDIIQNLINRGRLNNKNHLEDDLNKLDNIINNLNNNNLYIASPSLIDELSKLSEGAHNILDNTSNTVEEQPDLYNKDKELKTTFDNLENNIQVDKKVLDILNNNEHSVMMGHNDTISDIDVLSMVKRGYKPSKIIQEKLQGVLDNQSDYRSFLKSDDILANQYDNLANQYDELISNINEYMDSDGDFNQGLELLKQAYDIDNNLDLFSDYKGSSKKVLEAIDFLQFNYDVTPYMDQLYELLEYFRSGNVGDETVLNNNINKWNNIVNTLNKNEITDLNNFDKDNYHLLVHAVNQGDVFKYEDMRRQNVISASYITNEENKLFGDRSYGFIFPYENIIGSDFRDLYTIEGYSEDAKDDLRKKVVLPLQMMEAETHQDSIDIKTKDLNASLAYNEITINSDTKPIGIFYKGSDDESYNNAKQLAQMNNLPLIDINANEQSKPNNNIDMDLQFFGENESTDTIIKSSDYLDTGVSDLYIELIEFIDDYIRKKYPLNQNDLSDIANNRSNSKVNELNKTRNLMRTELKEILDSELEKSNKYIDELTEALYNNGDFPKKVSFEEGKKLVEQYKQELMSIAENEERTQILKQARETIAKVTTWNSLIDETRYSIEMLSLDPKNEDRVNQLKAKLASYEYYRDQEIGCLKDLILSDIKIPEYISKKAQELYEKYIVVEPDITRDLQALQDENASLIGEENKLKRVNRIAQKLTKKMMENQDNNLDNAIAKTKDVLRYTYVIEPDSYVDETTRVLDELKSKGYEIGKISNYWVDGDKTTYNGINIPISKVIDGKKYTFELQFHTLESYMMKGDLSHASYEIRQRHDLEKIIDPDHRTIEDDIYDIAIEMQEALEAVIDRPKGIDTFNYVSENSNNGVSNEKTSGENVSNSKLDMDLQFFAEEGVNNVSQRIDSLANEYSYLVKNANNDQNLNKVKYELLALCDKTSEKDLRRIASQNHDVAVLLIPDEEFKHNHSLSSWNQRWSIALDGLDWRDIYKYFYDGSMNYLDKKTNQKICDLWFDFLNNIQFNGFTDNVVDFYNFSKENEYQIDQNRISNEFKMMINYHKIELEAAKRIGEFSSEFSQEEIYDKIIGKIRYHNFLSYAYNFGLGDAVSTSGLYNIRAGFNSGINILTTLSTNKTILSNIVHEAIHKLSNNGNFSGFHDLPGKKGLGLNEGATHLFEGMINGKIGNNSYKPVAKLLESLIDSGVISKDEFFSDYLHSNLDHVIETLQIDDQTATILLNAFDDMIGFNIVKAFNAKKIASKIVNQIILQHNGLLEIKNGKINKGII